MPPNRLLPTGIDDKVEFEQVIRHTRMAIGKLSMEAFLRDFKKIFDRIMDHVDAVGAEADVHFARISARQSELVALQADGHSTEE